MSFSAARLDRKHFMEIKKVIKTVFEFASQSCSCSQVSHVPHYKRDSSRRHALTCLESSSLQREYRVMNFLAKALASTNPSATNMISQISSKSGTTIAHGLKYKIYKQEVNISLQSKAKILPKGSVQNE